MLAVLLGLLLASTWAQDSSIATSDATTPEATETVSLWLPMNGPADLSIQASIVSAAPDKVAYVLQCKPDNSNVLCRAYDPPITITQGESTIDFVHTYFRNPEETATLIKPITVRCKMGGAEFSRNRAATSALCTIGSDISGLGVIASTSRLASSEITYSPVTLTAGVAKMVAATATPAGTEVTASSTAAAEVGPRVTAMAVGGAVGMAILANM